MAVNEFLTAVPLSPIGSDVNGIAIRTSYDKSNQNLNNHCSH